VVICLEPGADLHMAQLMPLPLTVSCFSKIQIGFAFLVAAHPGSPGQRAVKRLCVCVCVCVCHLVENGSYPGGLGIAAAAVVASRRAAARPPWPAVRADRAAAVVDGGTSSVSPRRTVN